jgi:hypothetical protein
MEDEELTEQIIQCEKAIASTERFYPVNPVLSCRYAFAYYSDRGSEIRRD